MRHLHVEERTILRRGVAVEGRGLAEWVLKLMRSWRGKHAVQERQMHLVETLGLGGKRQLMLVSCDGERFLVGGGVESIETIVRVKADSSGSVTKNVDEICR